jgi:hypothetical protein
MSNRSQTAGFDTHTPEPDQHPRPLPDWLRTRLLRAEERITGVYGPAFNPPWERYVTHPALFLVAVGLGALWLGEGWLLAGVRPDLLPWAALAAGSTVLGSVFVLGLACGYFTRIVVTTSRLVILQGYEVCRSWRVSDLPPSLIRYRRLESGVPSPAVDLDTLNSLLGAPSDQVVEAKTILAFGKHLERIQARDRGRP